MAGFADTLSRAVKAALVVLMVLLVMAVTWQVLSRYLLAAPSSWTEELARFLLVWIGILGASHAFREKQHLGIDILLRALQAHKAAKLQQAIHATVIVFALLVMVIGGSHLVAITYELNQTSPALGLPMALVYSVVPLSGALIILYAVDALFAVRVKGDKPSREESQ